MTSTPQPDSDPARAPQRLRNVPREALPLNRRYGDSDHRPDGATVEPVQPISTWAPLRNTSVLLLLTGLLSIGGTLNMPNWIAIAPESVGREQLVAASSLNSISTNLSAAVGPAVAGIVIAQFGAGWVG